MNAGIFGNNSRDLNGKFRESIKELLLYKNINVLFSKEINSFFDISEFVEKLDFLICIGGDGTFLNVARRVYRHDIPIMGINYGSLGFLTNVERSETKKAIDKIADENFSIEKRMMLDATVIRNDKTIYSDTALNDIVIKNDMNSRIIHVKAYSDDTLIDNYPGDGLIVSTPTGSTAYSLSAGGPIVEPNTSQIIVTPICPHMLFARSFVTSTDRIIRAVIDENHDYKCVIKFDDKINMNLQGKDEIIFKKSKSNVNIISINRINYFDVLRKKLYNRGESLRKK